jgi:hypothetical protein
MAGSFEHGNDISGSLNSGEFPNQLLVSQEGPCPVELIDPFMWPAERFSYLDDRIYLERRDLKNKG